MYPGFLSGMTFSINEVVRVANQSRSRFVNVSLRVKKPTTQLTKRNHCSQYFCNQSVTLAPSESLLSLYKQAKKLSKKRRHQH